MRNNMGWLGGLTLITMCLAIVKITGEIELTWFQVFLPAIVIVSITVIFWTAIVYLAIWLWRKIHARL